MNNPIRLTDPDGMDPQEDFQTQYLQLAALIDGLSLNGAPGSQEHRNQSGSIDLESMINPLGNCE